VDVHPLLWPALVGALAVALAATGLALWRLRRPAPPAPLPGVWAVSPRPVFSTDERRVFRLLREALPHHTVLAKLPLVRFCQPSEADEVRYWYDLLGTINVTFAVCSGNGRVLAAVDLERPGSRRTLQIKQSVLGACRVRYLRIPIDHLPGPAELQALVPNAGAAGRFAESLPRPLSAASETLSTTIASRRAERAGRANAWQDSRSFGDSFFAPDSRFDGFTVTEPAEADLTPAELGALAASRDRDVAAIVLDGPERRPGDPRAADRPAA
jgi:hypothetical protein